MSTGVFVAKLPNCDLCAEEGVTKPAHFDAKTVMGPWAYLCDDHWLSHSVGALGTGLGQELMLVASEHVER